MKPARHEKLRNQLAAAEDDLLRVLGEHLPWAAEHGTLLFHNSDFPCPGLRPFHHSKTAEVLLEFTKEAQSLREQLGLPADQGPAHLYLTACREAADTSNEHRRGPRRLAEWLLEELNNCSADTN